MYALRPFKPSFFLKNLATITGRQFDLKVNPHGKEISRNMHHWFKEYNVYDEKRQDKFLTAGKFDLFAALSFSDADAEHLETCLAFYFWAFSADDLADQIFEDSADDEECQKRADKIEAGLSLSRCAFDPYAPRPEFPYAGMLHGLMQRVRKTATKGTCTRFQQAFENWGGSLVQQSKNRNKGNIPSVNEFIVMRRNTIGVQLVEAMIEYSLDLDLPDFVFQHPTIIAMSEATNDIMTWPNDLCSFNKEQADGDLSNLVCCVMVERQVELQEAVDILIDMLDARVTEYSVLKSQLPSFGSGVDEELGKYLQALEYFVQGTVVWYYKSPRYFKSSINLDHETLQISLSSSLKRVPESDTGTIGKFRGTTKSPSWRTRSNAIVREVYFSLLVVVAAAVVIVFS